MSDPLAPVLESLLLALDQMQRSNTAGRFRQEFAERGWRGLTVDDQRRVLTALAPDFIDEPQPVQDTHPPPLAPFAPFLDVLANAPSLLDATAQLARARTWDRVIAAVDELFVDVLGFDEERYDRSNGLIGRSQIDEIQVRARHGDLVVAAVKIGSSLADTRWAHASSHYARCFKLLPYALLVSFEPGTGSVRLVYQQRDDPSEVRPRYRCVSGPWFVRDPSDDLLSLARRFDLLRPRSGSGAGGELIADLQDVLEKSAGALADGWSSAMIEANAAPPGLPFPQAAAQLVHGFLQRDVLEAQRLHWGLQACLDHAFPMSLQYGRTRLGCEGYRLGDDAPDLWAAWRRGGTRSARIHLQLRLVSWDGRVLGEIFEVQCSLPVPDEEGRFLIDGQLLVFQPELGEDGRIISISGQEESEDEEEQEEEEGQPGAAGTDEEPEDQEPASLDAAEEEVEPEQSSDDERDAHAVAPGDREVVEGARIDRLLARLVDRRLGQIGRRLRSALRRAHWRGEAGFAPCSVLADLSVLLDEADELPLVSPVLLSTYLVPVQPDASHLARLRGTPDAIPAAPPAWACPELSSALEAGAWVPVSGARVHPMGSLAVRTTGGRGPVLESTASATAFDLNPRFGGRGVGRLQDWIADGLQPFAHLLPGTLAVPGRYAHAASTLPISLAARVEGLDRPRANFALRHGHRWQCRRVAFDIPSFPGVHEAPIPCVAEGSIIEEGMPWLHAPRALFGWHTEPPEQAIAALFDDALSRLQANDAPLLPKRDLVQVRIPWAGRGRVTGIGVEPRSGRYGLLSGWRAWIEVAMHLEGAGLIVDEEGRASPVEWTGPEDLPAVPDGEPLDLALPLHQVPSDHDIVFCGETGEARAAVPVKRAWWIPPALSAPLDTGRHRSRLLLDRDDAPAASERPALGAVDRRWWTLADPLIAAEALAEADALRRLAPIVELAAAGAVRPPRSLVPEPWIQPSPVEVVDTVDAIIPAAARLHNVHGHAERLIGMRCACGETRGEKLGGACCARCGTEVQPRPSHPTAPLRAWLLPFAVLHPWRTDLAGALLGLAETEFQQLLDSWGPVALAPVLAEHASNPLEAGLTRLTLPRDHVRRLEGSPRRALGLALEALRELTRHDGWFDELWIERVVVPPDNRMPAGLVAGASRPVASPILASIHQLQGALQAHKMLSRSAWEGARRSGVIGIQQAVATLFGPTEGLVGASDVAGLLARTWAPTRPNRPRVAWKGLCAAVGPVTLERELEDLEPQSERASASPFSRERDAVAQQLVDSAPDAWIRSWSRQNGRSSRGPISALRRSLSQLRLLSLLDLMTRGQLEWAAKQSRPNDARELDRLSDGEMRALLAGKSATAEDAAAAGGKDAARHLVPKVTEACTDHALLAVRLADRFVEIPARRVAGELGDAAWWKERSARERLARRWLLPLSAVLSRLDDPANHPIEGADVAWGAFGDAPMGWLAVVAAARALIDPQVRVAALLTLLEGPRRPLPTDPVKAWASMQDRLLEALPGDRPSRLALRSAITVAWTGWWSGPSDATYPSGLVWRPLGAAGPAGWRRTLLPLDHVAWHSWPEVMAVTSPARFLARAADVPLPSVLRLVFGLPVDVPPSLLAILEAEPWPERAQPEAPASATSTAPQPDHDSAEATIPADYVAGSDSSVAASTTGWQVSTVASGEDPIAGSSSTTTSERRDLVLVDTAPSVNDIRVLTVPLLTWIRRGAP